MFSAIGNASTADTASAPIQWRAGTCGAVSPVAWRRRMTTRQASDATTKTGENSRNSACPLMHSQAESASSHRSTVCPVATDAADTRSSRVGAK